MLGKMVGNPLLQQSPRLGVDHAQIDIGELAGSAFDFHDHV